MIRPCRTLEEFRACVALQKEVWGYAENEVYPLRLFVNLERIGGAILGAFTCAGRLAGFVASMPAWHGRERYYHSLALGVLPAFQRQGIGQALKWEQRRQALKAGIDCIEWTFDPTRAGNAFLNLERLGAIARRYVPDYYGAVESRLQRGLPSDRLISEWWLKASRARRAAKGQAPGPAGKEYEAMVRIPEILNGRAKIDSPAARAAQLKLRSELLALLRRRYVITGFSRDATDAAYLLERGFRIAG